VHREFFCQLLGGQTDCGIVPSNFGSTDSCEIKVGTLTETRVGFQGLNISSESLIGIAIHEEFQLTALEKCSGGSFRIIPMAANDRLVDFPGSVEIALVLMNASGEFQIRAPLLARRAGNLTHCGVVPLHQVMALVGTTQFQEPKPCGSGLGWRFRSGIAIKSRGGVFDRRRNRRCQGGLSRKPGWNRGTPSEKAQGNQELTATKATKQKAIPHRSHQLCLMDPSQRLSILISQRK
jgi:hypothetical protein